MNFSYVKTLVYMLQSSEYSVPHYLAWYWRTNNFSKVMYRRTLHVTAIAKALLLAGYFMSGVVLASGLGFTYLGLQNADWALGLLGGSLLIGLPVLVAHGLVVPVALGNLFILKPQRRRRMQAAEAIFSNHSATKIAVAGSYGKTTMKEILATVLSEKKNVAYTPANFNTAIAHARFAETLDGTEEVLILEYGEYHPDDVRAFAANTHPDIAIITGLNESHLDSFGSLEITGKSIFAVADYLDNQNTYVSGEDADLVPFIKKSHAIFSSKSALGWKASAVKANLDGLQFTMKKGKKEIKVHSCLLGAHNVAPLMLAAALAEKLGLSTKQIEAGLAKTKPFEHRMEPRTIGSDVVILDDTYNGSIDGVRAGLSFLGSLADAKRRVYVTPGLVEQGDMVGEIHQEIGSLIAEAGVDSVYLMANSVTDYIVAGLELSDFEGELVVIDRPLDFYENLAAVTKAGDVVLMQNDWTDNYA
jgi:UDP-N-acetylmuramoyl-tripeptide--D-alanyl-D-alanine ligase